MVEIHKKPVDKEALAKELKEMHPTADLAGILATIGYVERMVEKGKGLAFFEKMVAEAEKGGNSDGIRGAAISRDCYDLIARNKALKKTGGNEPEAVPKAPIKEVVPPLAKDARPIPKLETKPVSAQSKVSELVIALINAEDEKIVDKCIQRLGEKEQWGEIAYAAITTENPYAALASLEALVNAGQWRWFFVIASSNPKSKGKENDEQFKQRASAFVKSVESAIKAFTPSDIAELNALKEFELIGASIGHTNNANTVAAGIAALKAAEKWGELRGALVGTKDEKTAAACLKALKDAKQWSELAQAMQHLTIAEDKATAPMVREALKSATPSDIQLMKEAEGWDTIYGILKVAEEAKLVSACIDALKGAGEWEKIREAFKEGESEKTALACFNAMRAAEQWDAIYHLLAWSNNFSARERAALQAFTPEDALSAMKAGQTRLFDFIFMNTDNEKTASACLSVFKEAKEWDKLRRVLCDTGNEKTALACISALKEAEEWVSIVNAFARTKNEKTASACLNALKEAEEWDEIRYIIEYVPNEKTAAACRAVLKAAGQEE